MSTIHISSFSADFAAPYLYFVKCAHFAYIGESQHHPLIRWGDHLRPTGTFQSNLLSQHDFTPRDEPIFFGLVKLTQISNLVHESKRRLSTQWVEHQVHVMFSNSRHGVRFILVSDTTRSAPRRAPVDGLNDVAKFAFTVISEYACQ
jgi:hypothetical protein